MRLITWKRVGVIASVIWVVVGPTYFHLSREEISEYPAQDHSGSADRTLDHGSHRVQRRDARARDEREHHGALSAVMAVNLYLPIGQTRLADFLADRHHDALPADHGAEPKRDGDRDLDPERDIFSGVIELAFVGG